MFSVAKRPNKIKQAHWDIKTQRLSLHIVLWGNFIGNGIFGISLNLKFVANAETDCTASPTLKLPELSESATP